MQGDVIHIKITSSAQSKPVEVRILTPSTLPLGDERRFLYVLPVEKEGDSQYGDGVEEVRRLELHAISNGPEDQARVARITAVVIARRRIPASM